MWLDIGFRTSKVACCGQGPYNGLGLCTVLSNLCSNRGQYAFWDAFHPSEKANRLIVQHIMTGSNKYMYPMNLSTIMALDSRAWYHLESPLTYWHQTVCGQYVMLIYLKFMRWLIYWYQTHDMPMHVLCMFLFKYDEGQCYLLYICIIVY